MAAWELMILVHRHIWSYNEIEDTITVVDATENCRVAAYDMSSAADPDEEGLAIDFENGLMYLVVDGQNSGSSVSVYNFTYPEGLGPCLGTPVVESCSSFTVCGYSPPPCTVCGDCSNQDDCLGASGCNWQQGEFICSGGSGCSACTANTDCVIGMVKSVTAVHKQPQKVYAAPPVLIPIAVMEHAMAMPGRRLAIV